MVNLSMGGRFVGVLMVTVISAWGCGGETGSGGSAGAAGSQTTSGGGSGGQGGSGAAGGIGGAGGTGGLLPGTIELTVEGVTDSTNLILLAVTKSATAESGTVCEGITTSPFDHTEFFHTNDGDMNPCTGPEDEHVFPGGDLTVVVGTIMGGSKTYTLCTSLLVTVNGNQKVTAPPFAEWKAGPFDAMDPCNLE